MKFVYSILYVQSVIDTIAFYEKAFGFQRKFITPEGDYGELVTGETTISFASFALGATNFKNGFQKSSVTDQPFGIELAFTSENIVEDFATAIAAGAIEITALETKPWGQTVGYVRDNNGFLIEICTPIKPN
jgi:uncharacterized glyoxalase superfamily protein PhnB